MERISESSEPKGERIRPSWGVVILSILAIPVGFYSGVPMFRLPGPFITNFANGLTVMEMMMPFALAMLGYQIPYAWLRMNARFDVGAGWEIFWPGLQRISIATLFFVIVFILGIGPDEEVVRFYENLAKALTLVSLASSTLFLRRNRARALTGYGLVVLALILWLAAR